MNLEFLENPGKFDLIITRYFTWISFLLFFCCNRAVYVLLSVEVVHIPGKAGGGWDDDEDNTDENVEDNVAEQHNSSNTDTRSR